MATTVNLVLTHPTCVSAKETHLLKVCMMSSLHLLVLRL